MIVNKVLKKWSKPVSGSCIPYQLCVLEIHIWLLLNGLVLLWETKGDGLLQQNAFIWLTEYCAVWWWSNLSAMALLTGRQARGLICLQNTARCIAPSTEGSSNLEGTLPAHAQRHKVNGEPSFLLRVLLRQKDMSTMSRLEEPTNFQIAVAMMIERNMLRRCGMTNTGFWRYGSKLPLWLGQPSLNPNSSSRSPSVLAQLVYRHCHSFD